VDADRDVEATDSPRRDTIRIVGDMTATRATARDVLGRLIAASGRFDEENVGITADELLKNFPEKCPEIVAMNASLSETMEWTLNAANLGYRGWDAVRAGVDLKTASTATPPTVAAPPVRVAVVRRAPSSGRPGRSASTTSRRTAARGSPRLEDDPDPEPSRSSRASVIETLLDIDILFGRSSTAEAKRHATCFYCKEKHRGPYDATVRWYLGHECRVDEARARRNRAEIRRQGGTVFEAAA
jgi:hypothetical protein